VELRPGLVLLRRQPSESGRVLVPWRVPGFGLLTLSTASLVERFEPYDLAVELARGTLNDLQNQLADWQSLGLQTPAGLLGAIREARRHFSRGATARTRPAEAYASAQSALAGALAASRWLIEAYTEQVLERRLELTSTLPTAFRIDLPEGTSSLDPRTAEPFTAARVRCPWAACTTETGQFRWQATDAQLAACRKHDLAAHFGPLVDLRPQALPDWIWLWQGDADEIGAQAEAFVRAAVARYRGKAAIWHLVARPATQDVLGLSEEQQVRLTARLIQAARRVDPDTAIVVDLDRPWADWMSGGGFQLGPLHLADSLARADIGLSGISLEVAPGYDPWGGPRREVFEFSRLLDLYALIDLPLHVSIAAPSATAPAGTAGRLAQVNPTAWPTPPDEASQRDWAARWFALAAAKPFVHTVGWLELDDARPQLYPHAGLLRADHAPKPTLAWIRDFARRVHPTGR
jgi:hypothetical protein